jgi:integrase
MAKKIEQLTSLTVGRLQEPGYYHDGLGLYLQVSSATSKSWIFRYTLHGKTREMGLGSFTDFTLAEARERARTQRKLLADGADPIEAKRKREAEQAAEQADNKTFAECADAYIAIHLKGANVKKNAKHVQQWENTVKEYADPVIGKMNVRDVKDAHILRILEPIWNTKNETASRLRGRLEKILSWAARKGYRTGENPARWKGLLEHDLAKRGDIHKVEHLPALPYKEINPFVVALRVQPGVAARAVELAVLTAVRSGEARGAKPAEFDLEAAVWTIPAERMKMKKEHRVPLCPRAVELIQERLKAGGQYIFPNTRNGKPLSDMALTAVLRRMERTDITVHGFRSSFREWVAEQTNYPGQLAEFALAHKLPNDVEAAYLRSDMLEKRRHMMSDWADYCDRPKADATVTPIRKAA